MDERVTTAGIAIKEGKVLVAHRVQGGSLSEKWEFPGGKQRWGENDEETLRREYMEELGVPISVHEEIVSFDFTNKTTLYHLTAHLIELLSEDFNLKVHSEIKWVPSEELFLLDMGESDSRIRSRVASFLLNT